MNHIYRTVWNEVSRTFVAVAETMRRKGKAGSATSNTQCGEATLVLADRWDGYMLEAQPRQRQALIRRGLRPLALEQRFMFDGAAVATTVEAAHAQPDAAALALIPAVPAPVEVRAVDPSSNAGKKEVAFVDTSVANYRTLEAGIHAGVEIVEIDGGQSGLAQIAKWAESHAGYDAIHILGHGSEGTLYLGSDTLTADKLDSPVVQAELAELGHALAAGGDLLLYGCDIGKDEAGQALVAGLASATGADVAASTDATGNSAQGGNWTLEAASGAIDVSALAIADYTGTLAATTFTGDSGDTSTDATVGGGGSQYAINITDNASGNTLHIASTGAPMNLDTAVNLGDAPTGMTGKYIKTDWNVDWTTSVTLSVLGGKLFDFKSLGLQEANGTDTTFIFTPNGGAGQTSAFTANQYKLIDYSGNASFQGISTLTITAVSGQFQLSMDDITLDNIHLPGPTVTDANISISGASGTGGAYKIGDTVTATWNNTSGGDNNAGITGVTVDFSAFGGGSAVTASNSSGTWTATYTIVSGAIDGTNKNVSVTATTASGSTTTADSTNATVDNIAPTVTDANISISGASGTGGAYKIGDTVTATWNNTAGGDNNSDTISGVTVDFSAFGGGSAVAATNSGGTWTATYTITAGAINGVTNRNVSVTATDNAGNAKTTADTTNATVDNVAPAITFSNLAFSADTGSSGTDFITATAAQTLTATLSGAPAGTDIVYGSLDNGATWTNITGKVSGTTLTWDGVTLTGSSTLKLKVTDSAGNDGTVLSQAYTLDTSNPSAPSAPDMTPGTDTGTSNSDNLTNNTTPTFTGTAEAGAAVTLYDTDGTTVLGSATAAGGSWSITSSALSEGSHTLTAKATDAAGNTSSASSGLAVTIDTSAPTGLAVSATTIASSTATSGATIATLSATDVQPITYSLAVGNGTNDANNGSFTITGTSLKVGGAALTAGTYKIYVAATDAAGNVSYQAFTLAVVDAPAVTSIVRTGGASVTVAASATSIDYTVTFDQSVTGVDASDFTITPSGTATGSIAGVTGSGTTYTVTVNNLSGDGTLRLDLNGSGTGIQNGSNVDILGGYASGQTYTLDHTQPSAPSTPDMTAGTDTGTSSSDDITGNTTPTFTGTAEADATVTLYDTDGTTVLGTATAAGGNWSITSSALSEGSHTLTAKATDAAGNTSSPSTGLAIAIDTTAPEVASVAVPANGSYKAGQPLSFTVTASEAVTVDTSGGTPRLALDIGGSTVYASYASGSGSTALVFTYTVQPGDTDSNGIAVTTLQSNGGTLKDTAGNGMTLTLNSVGSTAGVLVDTTAPTVNSVSVPANGTYYNGQNLDFTVNFSEAVTVNTSGGTPHIAIALDTGGTVYADYLSGSGTSALVFRHSVANGEKDTTGVTVGALSANGGTLRDAAGNDATLILNSVSSTAAVNVDGTQPSILNVTSTTADGDYKAGSSITVTVTFSTAVTVDTTGGTPTLALGSGGTATYASGSGSTTLVFTYTVGAGENSPDLDYASTGALSLNGATIKDGGGSHQDALLTLFTPGAAGSLGANKAIVVDTTPPSITFSNLALSADTGSSASDFITATAAQTITATLSGAPAGTDRVYGSLNGGATWTDITGKVSGTTLTWNGVTLTGSNTLKLKVTDAAGNDGAVKSQAYALDTTAPIITVDAVISNTTTPVLTGTANEGALTVTVGGATYHVTPAGGVWRLDLATAVPVSGTRAIEVGHTYSVAVTATDAAGNSSSATGSLSVVALPPPPATHSNAPNLPVETTPPILLPEPAKGDTPANFLSPATEKGLNDALSGASMDSSAFVSRENVSLAAYLAGSPRGIGFQGLLVNRPMPDQVVGAAGSVEIQVPADTFTHFGADSAILLSAQQANGRPLPNWVKFDPASGKFVIKAPPGVSGELTIRLVARDSQGHEANTIFKVRVGGNRQAGLGASGRAGLSEQIRTAAQQAGSLDRFAGASEGMSA